MTTAAEEEAPPAGEKCVCLLCGASQLEPAIQADAAAAVARATETTVEVTIQMTADQEGKEENEAEAEGKPDEETPMELGRLGLPTSWNSSLHTLLTQVPLSLAHATSRALRPT